MDNFFLVFRRLVVNSLSQNRKLVIVNQGVTLIKLKKLMLINKSNIFFNYFVIMNEEIAILGGGCFWGVEHKLSKIAGVVSTCVGYSGGSVANPTYEQVCGGKTGHIEVVEVRFDPQALSFEELLTEFWNIHDPTARDKKRQYSSTILYKDAQQKEIATRALEQLQKNMSSPPYTTIEPFKKFYPAEEYHQKYIDKNR